MTQLREITVNVSVKDCDVVTTLVRRLMDIALDADPHATAAAVREDVRRALQDMVIGDLDEIRVSLGP